VFTSMTNALLDEEVTMSSEESEEEFLDSDCKKISEYYLTIFSK